MVWLILFLICQSTNIRNYLMQKCEKYEKFINIERVWYKYTEKYDKWAGLRVFIIGLIVNELFGP